MTKTKTKKPASNAAAVQITAPAKLPKDCPYAEARRRGWEDVRAGRAPDADIVDGKPDPARGPVRDDKGKATAYGKELRLRAYAYERGRFQATLAKIAGRGRPLPEWTPTQYLDGVLNRYIGAPAARVLLAETAVGRSNAKRRKPAPVVIPVAGGPVRLPRMPRRRGRMSGEAEALMIESRQR